MMIMEKKLLRILTIILGLLVVSNDVCATEAIGYRPGDTYIDPITGRPMRVTPQGEAVPNVQEGWWTRTTTFQKEYKPVYDVEAQRVKVPTYRVEQAYDGRVVNTQSPTVKPAWYDRATTYHEEQRRPWNPYDSTTKKIPAYMYYDKDEAASANKHYLQDDLRPVPYMYGSASLVLRKEQNADDYLISESSNLDGIANPDSAYQMQDDGKFLGLNGRNPYAYGMNGVDLQGYNGYDGFGYDGYGIPNGGYDTINERGKSNCARAAAEKGVMIVSDPNDLFGGSLADGNVDGINYNKVYGKDIMIGDPKGTDVQVATKIADPNVDWRNKIQRTPSDLARPGDFDYREAATKGATVPAYRINEGSAYESGEFAQQGATGQDMGYQGSDIQIYEDKGGQYIVTPEDTANPESDFYIINGFEGQDDNYQVVDGDTLSEISEKERIYGDWTLWPLIYDANRYQVNDPDLIYPGQNLDIPRSYSLDDESNAKQRAKNR